MVIPSPLYTMDTLSREFVASEAVYGTDGAPVRDRWTSVLAWCPAARSAGVHGNYTAVYRDALAADNPQTCFGCLELADLQVHFYWFLLSNNLTFLHVAYANYMAARMFRDKLAEKYLGMLKPHVNHHDSVEFYTPYGEVPTKH